MTIHCTMSMMHKIIVVHVLYMYVQCDRCEKLYTCRSLHNQLLQEGPSESFVKKRVDLLKTQVVQLERQVPGYIASCS